MNDNLFECNSCGDSKPRSAMIQNKNKPGGIDRECRRCRQERENTPDARRQRKDRQFQSKYGVTLRDYEQLVIKQNGRCACCKRPETRLNKYGEPMPLSLDHDHQTKKVRGAVCAACNCAIGKLGDTPEGALKALNYLWEARG